ncbi:ABC transporter permease subunit [Paenibacillus sp. HB172176]|uniref:ABC transporter permease n=1 Tax=Paenibacillus sp. HB172176 TaxID=2493690 RepID=UPI00143C111B|nr:ABC transporter permease subunit [Paenibacillus sp. HB172176]
MTHATARERWRHLKKTKVLSIMMIPALVYFILFHYVPLYGILIAFKDFKMMAGYSFFESIMRADWIGFEHFKDFIYGANFWKLLRNTLLLSLYGMIFGFPLPILFALLLNEVRRLRYKKLVQTVSYLPHFISVVAVVGMMKLLLSPENGLINQILHAWFGLDFHYYFGDAAWFRTLYVGSGIWQGLGWGAVIYIAALSKVDSDMYESSVLDGASRIRQMWHISLPAIRPTIMILLILEVGNFMSLGTEKIILMYSPATYETADVISTYVYRRGLVDMQFSFATAVGLFNSLINLVLLVTVNALSRKMTDESLW